MLEVGALLAGAEVAAAEKAVETLAAASELEGIKDLAVTLKETTAPIPEIFADFEPAINSGTHKPWSNMFTRPFTAGAKSEFAMEILEMLESSELAEEAELAEEVSEHKTLNETLPESKLLHTVQSAFFTPKGGYFSSLSRLSERAAASLRDVALRKNAEVALANDVAEAEVLKKNAELLEDIAHISDVAGDYFKYASYPEHMIRNSPGSK